MSIERTAKTSERKRKTKIVKLLEKFRTFDRHCAILDHITILNCD